MTDLNALSKADLNARLAEPLNASALKKMPKADLVALVAKQEKPKAARKPRVLGAHTYCLPVDDAQKVVPVREGSKKHALFSALLKGATMEELQEATGWQRSVVQSSFGYDVPKSGFGVKRTEDGTYWLLMPKALAALPVITAEVDRAAALVAACR